MSNNTNETENTQKKSFFERMGEILNAPLPGTEAKTTAKPVDDSEVTEIDDSLLSRIKDILNTPLPGNDTLEGQVELGKSLDEIRLEVTEKDVPENWWDTDWKEFKAHQDLDRKGLNVKQRQDQEGFAQYQEQERFQFEMYQAQEFDMFQAQQQAKINWIQEQQLAQAEGVQVAGMLPPAPPVAPLPPEMPVPPWMKIS